MSTSGNDPGNDRQANRQDRPADPRGHVSTSARTTHTDGTAYEDTAGPRPVPASSAASSTPTYGDHVATSPVVNAPLGQRQVEQRQREQFGGMKVGAAFFGWLTATGAAVILTALVAVVATALGLTGNLTVDQAANDPQSLGVVGGIVLLAVVFLAYYCGGYVAGRMARFHGGRQGLGVWLWAIVIAIALALVGLIAGSEFNILGRVGLPQITSPQSGVTLFGIVSALLALGVSLVGAVLGGLSGMRFHRKVDRRTDLTPKPVDGRVG